MTGVGVAEPSVARILERSDFWRRSPASAGGAWGHKEWSYFCVLAEDVELIVNLSIMDQPGLPGGRAGRAEEARVAVLARTGEGLWEGDVETCDSVDVMLRAGRIDTRMGRTALAFVDGAYHLDAAIAGGSVEASLVLRPAARPALTRSVPLGPYEPMHWLVVPRLEASGFVRVGTGIHTLHRSPAYHDHNWGRFAWGDDFAWEWGIVLAGSSLPWSLIYYRITDRGRHNVRSQGVLIWRRDRHCRTFSNDEIGIRTSGPLRVGRCLRVPRVMSLAIPGTAADIPRLIEIEAHSGRDSVNITLDLDDCAQVGLPNDADPGITAISECRGRATISGRLRGETVQADGPAIVEFNRAA